jgi:hypothetical protein
MAETISIHVLEFCMFRLNQRKHLFILFGMLALGLAVWHPAQAHTRIETGPYIIVVGWEVEPVIVGERNAIWLEILEGDVPVSKEVKVNLEASVFYGGQAFLGFPAPSSQPGVFLMDMFPTIRGTYDLQLTGTIGETPVEALIELDEVQPASILQFPEKQPDPIQLQTELKAIQAQLRTVQILAIAGLAAGLLGLGAAAFSLIRRART